MESLSDIKCILCGSDKIIHVHRDDERRGSPMRDYYRCSRCKLIFVLPEQRLSPEDELSRYEMHENDPDDPRYRKFLSRMFKPMLGRIEPLSYGLDFGSGPGPTLSVMFEEAGHTVRLFDVFYDNNPSVFSEKYDFITTTETVEHLFQPLNELSRLWSCLKPGGWLGIMTKVVRDLDSFKKWHYKNDPTHVIFFSRGTFLWLGRYLNTEPEFCGNDVVLFNKPENLS